MSLGFARKMWALDCPSLTVDAVTLMYGLSGKLTIPMPAFLIEHPKGLVLFDTGIHPDAIQDAASVYGRDLADALGLSGSVDQRIDRQIEALGYRTTDVTHVVSSHLHFDHAGGHFLFPHATFYAGQGELAFAHYPAKLGNFCFMPDQVALYKNWNWREVPSLTDLDLFGDGSMVILSTPGHTPGEVSLKVRLANRTFLLTGDALHLRAALDLEWPFPLDVDTISSIQSLLRIKRMAESEELSIWINHDPDDWAEYHHAPHCYE